MDNLFKLRTLGVESATSSQADPKPLFFQQSSIPVAITGQALLYCLVEAQVVLLRECQHGKGRAQTEVLSALGSSHLSECRGHWYHSMCGAGYPMAVHWRIPGSSAGTLILQTLGEAVGEITQTVNAVTRGTAHPPCSGFLSMPATINQKEALCYTQVWAESVSPVGAELVPQPSFFPTGKQSQGQAG